jgi:cytochrome P450
MTTSSSDDTGILLYPLRRAAGHPFDPPPTLSEFQSRDTICRVRIWDGSTPWLVTKYDEQRQGLTDPRISSDNRRDGYPPHYANGGFRALPTFINLDPPDHGTQRRLLTGHFSVKAIERMRPRIQAIVDSLLDRMLSEGAEADLHQAFSLPLPSLVICEMLGVPYDDHEFFQQRSAVMVSTSATPEEGAAATQDLRTYIEGLVEKKASSPQDDLISKLVHHESEGALTRVQLVDLVMVLLVAGHETSANQISTGVLALLLHPDQSDELRATDDPRLVAQAVEELLRYLTVPLTGRRRVALEDMELGGVTIRAGEGVIFASEIGNRDRDAFPGNPDELDIHRDARHHMAFGYGIHQCLGQPLARAELQIAYKTILERVPTLRLGVDFADLRFREDSGILGLFELPVKW